MQPARLTGSLARVHDGSWLCAVCAFAAAVFDSSTCSALMLASTRRARSEPGVLATGSPACEAPTAAPSADCCKSNACAQCVMQPKTVQLRSEVQHRRSEPGISASRPCCRGAVTSPAGAGRSAVSAARAAGRDAARFAPWPAGCAASAGEAAPRARALLRRCGSAAPVGPGVVRAPAAASAGISAAAAVGSAAASPVRIHERLRLRCASAPQLSESCAKRRDWVTADERPVEV
jgi:hypothetical protein